MALEETENVVRAVPLDKWDEVECRLSPSLFKDPKGVSVSRLIHTPIQEQWPLLRRITERPPERILAALAEINVGDLQKIGISYKTKKTKFGVEEDPLIDFTSHALIHAFDFTSGIPTRVSDGLARTIVDSIVSAKKLHFPLTAASNGNPFVGNQATVKVTNPPSKSGSCFSMKFKSGLNFIKTLWHKVCA